MSIYNFVNLSHFWLITKDGSQDVKFTKDIHNLTQMFNELMLCNTHHCNIFIVPVDVCGTQHSATHIYC